MARPPNTAIKERLTESHGNFWENTGHFFSRLGDTHTRCPSRWAWALAILMLGKKFLTHKPVAGLFKLKANGNS